MILVDISSILHRMIHGAVQAIKPTMNDRNKYNTSEFSGMLKYLIINELFKIEFEHKHKFKEMVICLDNSIDGYWRKDFFPDYKASRKEGRDESSVDYSEVFEEINELLNQIKENVPWKVIDVPKAEADDIMLVLAREYNSKEKILIHSPDKDMIQAQKGTDNVYQYSALTKKWLVPENKHDNMEHWLLEHVCLGDASDGVPRIFDSTDFSDNFIKYLKENNISYLTPHDFKNSDLTLEEKNSLLTSFDIYKTNRKGEQLDKDIYKDHKIGSSTLEKLIIKHGSLDKYLDSHPMYRKNYERNYTLVMEQGIPEYIWVGITEAYKTAPTKFNRNVFEDYLEKNNLNKLKNDLPNIFKETVELTAENCGW